MRWQNTKKTENEGVLYVQQVTNRHGSIFRKIHQEEDVGIDGTIEIVRDQQATGLLLAVQVKSGESYVQGDKFVVVVDQAHINYWQRFMLPVILICYSPVRQKASWCSISHYLEKQKLSEVMEVSRIEIPFTKEFDENALENSFHGIALAKFDEAKLFQAADLVLSAKPENRREGMLQISAHPLSRATRMTARLASELILDEDVTTVQLALSALGFCVAHKKWSFYPAFDVSDYAWGLCVKFTERHVRNMLRAVTDGDFGPMSLGEACMDCIACLWGPDGEAFTRAIVLDENEEMYVRANALVLFYAGEWSELFKDEEIIRHDGLDDIVNWLKEKFKQA